MKTFNFWARPAILAVLWILASALTLSELATVAPTLRSAQSVQQVHASRYRPVAARSQASVRLATAP